MASLGIDEIRKRFNDIRDEIGKLRYLVNELKNLTSYRARNQEQGNLISSRIFYINNRLKLQNRSLYEKVAVLNIARPLTKKLNENSAFSNSEYSWEESEKPKESIRKIKVDSQDLIKEEDRLKKSILKRFKRERKITKEKEFRRPNFLIVYANKMFFDRSVKLSGSKGFDLMKKDLVKSGMNILPSSYISLMLLITLVVTALSILAYIFLIFIDLSITFPVISAVKEGFLRRILINLWIPVFIPALTFVFMYYYPSLEKKSIGNSINQELPFVVIHMSAVAGSMIEPSKMFSVIISTKEYPHTRKEFIKLINQVNIYGYDLVTALRDAANKSPSAKLAELYRGLATTVVSGGSLNEFLDKRAQSLLFEYRIDREKYTKMTESFMDIYISVVIAAPMIFMLVLILIRISNIGLGLSAQAITVLIISVVVAINIFFLVFLQMKQPET